MDTNENRPEIQQLRTRSARAGRALALAALVGLAAAPEAGAAVALDPLLAGQYAAGTGANATFLRIDGGWTGTSVYWKEPSAGSPGQYSNTGGDGFVRIGEYGWGTGLWGLADWRTVNAPGSTLPVQGWSGVVSSIDHGDPQYAAYAAGPYASWGAVGALPGALFAGDGGALDNWTSHYTGYLRITDPGSYNFGVLYDDGFFLRIWGADDTLLEISSDFLSPRDRLGFSEDLLLDTGLYRFELGAYDRLEAGVVNLAWRQGAGAWQTVPTEHLVTEPAPLPAAPVPVSAPATIGVLLAGATALAAVRKRQRKKPS